jgi:glycosyltransferase involved in cell wall biosynthesis
MIYYFLPGSGIYGGVKVGGQFVDLLNSVGIGAVLVLPNGIAPDWFPMSAPVIAESEARERFTDNDWAMFSFPGDHPRLKLFARKIAFHCQGTDRLIDSVCADPEILLMTCWSEAARYVRSNFNRNPVEVGIAISDSFIFDGSKKFDNRVAYMPRRGFRIAQECIRRNKNLDFVAIDNVPETTVSLLLKEAGVFLATSEGEFFGLPALEAMTAGCLVLSVPVKGGEEYLHDGQNCFIVEPDEMTARLECIMRDENALLRMRLRAAAIATGLRYRRAVQRKRLAALLESDLTPLLS